MRAMQSIHKILTLGLIIGAASSWPLTQASAFTSRIQHSHCKEAPGSTGGFDEVDGFYSTFFAGNSELYCPISESDTRAHEGITNAKIYYENEALTSAAAHAKACISRRFPTSALLASSCSLATNGVASGGYRSMDLGDISVWASNPNEYAYILITLDAPSNPTAGIVRFRGIELTY